MAKKRTIGLLSMALVVNLLLASTLQVREAHACWCAGGLGAEEQLRNSDAVFWGEAVSVEESRFTSSVPPFLDPVTFDVKEVWKGVSGERVTVHGQGMEASCGLNFHRGETYLVFAYHVGKGEDGPLGTDLCTATSALSDVEAAPAALGPPTGKLPDTGGPDAWSLRDGLLAAAVVGLGSLALAGMILSRGRGRDGQP